MRVARTDASRNVQRVGLIEIPDRAIHVMNHFLRSPVYDVQVVVCHDPRCRVAKVARRWNLRVQPLPNRSILQACDRLIVGDDDPCLLRAVQSFVADRDVQVQSLRMAIKELVERPTCAPLLRTDGAGRFEAADVVAKSPASQKLFDPRAVLGLAKSEASCGITINTKDPRIKNHVDQLVRDVGALTGSIMLMDADGAYLRFAWASGMGGSVPPSGRLRSGEGLAGRAFQQGRPLFRQQVMPQWAESVDTELHRLGCSIPLVLGARTLGVLSVNLESQEAVSPEALIECLERRAQETVRLLLLAVRADLGDDGSGLEILKHLVGQLVCLEESILLRMDAVAEVIARSIRAERYQLYLADRRANRFQRVSRDAVHGMRLDPAAPISGSFLGWVLDRGKPQAGEYIDGDTSDRTAVVYLPICSLRLPAMLVLENLKIPRERMQERLSDLADLTRIVEDLMLVEEGVSDQDFVSELEMRIADEMESLTGSSREAGISNVLRLATELLAADVAVWVDRRNGLSVSVAAAEEFAEFARTIALAHTDRLVQLALQEGCVRGGPDAVRRSDGSIPCPLRYAGVRAKDESGVLLFFFSPYDDLGTYMQVTAEALFRVIDRLCDRLVERAEDSRDAAGPALPELPENRAAEREIDPDADILMLRSGGERVGVLWQFVERVASGNASCAPGNALREEAPPTVSLGTCIGADTAPENYYIILSESGIRLKLTCEHIGGLSRMSAVREDGSGRLRILHADDFLSSCSGVGQSTRTVESKA